MEFRHIINGCSINLRQLTDHELNQLISSNGHRAVVQRDELESLYGEQIRRRPIVVPPPDAPTLF